MVPLVVDEVVVEVVDDVVVVSSLSSSFSQDVKARHTIKLPRINCFSFINLGLRLSYLNLLYPLYSKR